MPNKMLIDATHPEETRVVVLRGNKVEEFDFESAQRKQLRGNIYLAKVTRVEPSLQAAFVDYGGNRHGFLAFSEIHPDYYQIPVADRQALIDEESRAQRAADEETERRQRPRRRHAAREDKVLRSEPIAVDDPAADQFAGEQTAAPEAAERRAGEAAPGMASPPAESDDTQSEKTAASGGSDETVAQSERRDEAVTDDEADQAVVSEAPQEAAEPDTDLAVENGHAREDGNGQSTEEDEEVVESVGGADALEEVPERMVRPRRRYKIQEVIKRRQIMLVQVVKEERGTKGAALTTYLSLAGRYSVLMPNTARGGGISRKITNPEDRKRLKEVAEELEVPEGMGVILRTAGANRTKTEIKRDFEYLLRLWETVRDLTLKSTAPSLVYEEGSLVKRAIRDLYSKEIEEIIVAGDAAYHEAKEFMRMLMPSHVKNIKAYKDTQPLFTRHGIEAQLDAMFQPTVQLKSGGYIVLNQAEALVAIDVNSGRATREHSIEETALKTNLEAAAEIARQLRLRDLAGLIVIDFIDMDEKRNNRAVERKLKEALKSDRARIQVGRISHFGLLEMSRQRIRTSVLESSTEVCPHCGGTGHVRSVSSVALQLLRTVEEMLLKGATHNLVVRTRSDIALYVLNNKRAHLRALEERFRIVIAVQADAAISGQPPFVIERGEQVMSMEQAKAIAAEAARALPRHEEEEEVAVSEEAPAEADEMASTEAREGRRRRRGRRGRGRGHEGRGVPPSYTAETVGEHTVAHAEDFEPLPEGEAAMGEYPGAEPSAVEPRGDAERRRRRRGRRGGRRRRHRGEPAATFGEHGETTFGDRPDRPEPADERPAPFEREESLPAHADHSRGEAPPPPPAPEVPAGEAEPPRRRSTVREPAPIFGGGEAPPPAPPETPPPPQPVIHEQHADEAEKPRRTGWWSRRV